MPYTLSSKGVRVIGFKAGVVKMGKANYKYPDVVATAKSGARVRPLMFGGFWAFNVKGPWRGTVTVSYNSDGTVGCVTLNYPNSGKYRMLNRTVNARYFKVLTLACPRLRLLFKVKAAQESDYNFTPNYYPDVTGYGPYIPNP